jgi:uncharacterized membrane protein
MTRNFALSLFVLGAILTATAQLLLKLGALKRYSGISQFLNVYVISGYFILVFVTGISVIAYRGIEFKAGPIVAALSYAIVVFLSRFILKEKINNRKFCGVLFVIVGILIFIY